MGVGGGAESKACEEDPGAFGFGDDLDELETPATRASQRIES